MTAEFDAVIVGMGPAGMAAATELAGLGARVAVVDENPRPGGQVYRQPPAGLHRARARSVEPKLRHGRDLIERFEGAATGITLFNDASVWGFFNPDRLALARAGRILQLRFRKLLLAEGAMERSVPFPGWTLPGIMTLGGLQRLVQHQGVLPGRRFLLGGCSPLLLPVAALLVENGAEKVTLCDALPFSAYPPFLAELLRQKGPARDTLASLLPLLKKRVAWHSACAVTAAAGRERVQRVTLTRLNRRSRAVRGSKKQLPVDVAAISYGFLPASRLARLCGCDHHYDPVAACWRPRVDAGLRTSRREIHVAGDAAGIGGARLAEVEGRIAALAMAADLDLSKPSICRSRLAVLERQRRRMSRYADLVNRIFTPAAGLYSIITPETVVCRCERVTAGEVRKGIAAGYRNINRIKRTRAGMGLCQARTCETVIASLMIASGIPAEEVGLLQLRPPLVPMSASVFRTLDAGPGGEGQVYAETAVRL